MPTRSVFDSADEAEFQDSARYSREQAQDSANPNKRSGGFSIGSIVFPVDKIQDFVDPESVLINNVDSYIGKYIGQFLSERVVGSAANEDELTDDEFEGEGGGGRNHMRFWKVLGTFKDNKSMIPQWLWAVMQNDNYDAYLREVIKCQVIIYDVTDNPTPEKFEEIRAVCDALRAKVPTFKTRRVFILVSTLHSWCETKPPDSDPELYLSELDYRRRRTKQAYRDLQLLERYVVAAGKMTRGMLKCYVIGAGAVYGEDEGPLHSWFKSAWHNAKHLNIYGTGKNFLPTIYIKDLATIVQNVMDLTPKPQRYILAVDPVICQQDQIVKAISSCLGTGRVKKVEEEEIFLNRELTTFEADQLLLDLKIESGYSKDNFNMYFTAESGFTNIIARIASEYKKARNLEPLKVCILGPPGVGKSTAAKQISDIYRLNHFTKEDMIKSTIEMLREIAGDVSEPDIVGVDVDVEDKARTVAKALLAEIDGELQIEKEPSQDPDEEPLSDEQPTIVTRKSVSHLQDDLICRIYRYRLLTNQCQNQGFVLDGFPETFQQARMLLIAGGVFLGEERGEDPEEGKDALDPRLVFDKVVILEAPDEFLFQRLLTIPDTSLQDRHTDKVYPAILGDYRQRMNNYENTFMYYLDLQEMIYFPIDVSMDNSNMLISTIGKISDMLGKPRNYGLTTEEEEALKNAQQLEIPVNDDVKEDLTEMESRELEERRNNIQQWMEKLAKIKREEFEREEASLIPLRHYLMAHVVPTLTKGLIEVTRVRPFDPLEFLAEFLFQHNPGSINTSSALKYKEDTKHTHAKTSKPKKKSLVTSDV